MRLTTRGLLIGLMAVLFLLPFNSLAHELRTPVIIDTDMALDDVRAVTLMLSSQHVQVKAIVTSDGSSSPEAGYHNLLRVLSFLGVSNVPVGIGRTLNQPPPLWRQRSESLGWADLPVVTREDVPDAVPLILSLFQENEEGITYVCLGPMTNLADALRKEPSIRSGIRSIIFYGTLPDAPARGWNTERDPEAVRAVLACRIPMYFFHLEEHRVPAFDEKLLEETRNLGSKQSSLINLIHRDDRIQKLVKDGHLRMWDETVALFLDDPSLAVVHPIEGKSQLYALAGWDTQAARKAYLRLVSGWAEHDLAPREPVVLNRYPTNPHDFQEDVRPLVPKLIPRYGLEEWKAVVLTNELHRHLGVYSILGAKMGIRARELLGASLDDLHVESHAGLKPPLSCMNDGLQASTGASLGRGTITITEGESTPAATFIRGNKRLCLCVKDEVVEQIEADFKKAIDSYGALSSEYFKEVRRLSLKYWMEMDRRTIFEQRNEVQALNK